MKKYFSIFSLALAGWLVFGNVLHAQVLRGRITDAEGRPVSNASLFVKELKLGTSANDRGEYELKLSEGVYTCVFQCIGYETESQRIEVGNATVVRDVTLREKAYELKEVVISDNKEDPAYGIMRRAIAMAPYYKNQVSEFDSDVYIKGSLQIIKISRLVKRLAKEELKKYKEGNTYVEESFSEIQFTAPNKYRQRVLKKTGSLPEADGKSAIGLITAGVYDTEALEPIISPLSSSAFAQYRFRYEGFIEEDNRIINKIRITPVVKKSKQLVSGYIYIADNYWNVHSVDVAGEFLMGINFRLQVNFGEVNENVWLPISHRIAIDGAALGNKGSYRYTSSIRYKKVTENTSIRKPDALLLAEQQRKAMQEYAAPPLALSEKTAPKSKTGAKIEKLLEKEDLSNRESYRLARLMKKEADAEKDSQKQLDVTETVYNRYRKTEDSTAGERDTAYWAKMRPVPLNSEELRSYQEKEALPSVLPPPGDTSQNVIRKKSGSPFVRGMGKIFGGADFKLGKRGGTLEYRGLRLSRIGFNTVDGFFIGQKIAWYKDLKERRRENRLTVEPEVVWAINRKAVMWDVDASLSYAALRRGNISVRLGHTSADYIANSIHPLENTVMSLFLRRNYLKLYNHRFVEINNNIDLANGLSLTTRLNYARRTMLDNSSDYSFFFRKQHTYTPNVPVNVEQTDPPVDHTTASFMLNIDYTPRLYYFIDRNNRKRTLKSSFPTFFTNWQKGVSGIMGSNSNYDQLTLGVYQNIETGLMQQFSYFARGGVFVNSKRIFLPDFRHFTTVRIPLTIGSIGNTAFSLLEYYRYSTADKYFEAHVYYYSPFLALKYLPFFSNRLWQEGVQLNYLHTSRIKNYTELGYTIGLVWQAGVFVGFENFKYRSVGVKLSLPVTLFM